MIDKILHTHNPLTKEQKNLFPDFVFITWPKDKSKYQILWRYGGIFMHEIVPLKNFYNYLDPVKLNIIERKLEKGFALSTNLVASEKNLPGLKYIVKDLEDKTEGEVIKKWFEKERDGFSILPYDKKCVEWQHD